MVSEWVLWQCLGMIVVMYLCSQCFEFHSFGAGIEDVAVILFGEWSDEWAVLMKK
jgi:hypothetical protein